MKIILESSGVLKLLVNWVTWKCMITHLEKLYLTRFYRTQITEHIIFREDFNFFGCFGAAGLCAKSLMASPNIVIGEAA